MPNTPENTHKDKCQALFERLDNTANHSQTFFQRHAKTIFSSLTVLMLIVVGYFAYTKLYLAPHKEKALKELFYAKQHFNQNDMKKALGDKKSKGGYLGFIDIAKKYSSTKEGNIAQYYAGVCHYRLGHYQKAIEAWGKFSARDEILSSMKYGMIGDAYTQLKKNKDALKYYLKAARKRDNSFTTPLYYYKAAMVALFIHKYQEAKKYLTEIKEKYPDAFFAADIDQYLALIDQKSQKSS